MKFIKKKKSHWWKIIILILIFILIVLMEIKVNTRATIAHLLEYQIPRFYVKTSMCQMRYVNPYEHDAMSFFKPHGYKKCAKDNDLVTVIYNQHTHQHRLKIVGEANRRRSDIVCCYQQIVRGNNKQPDKSIKIHRRCKKFANNFIVPKSIDAIIVNCKANKKHWQRLAFSFVHWKPSNGSKERSGNKSASYPSVLIFGIDSLSRINFRRNMPWTHEYLKKHKWFELEGYNKMGDNTFPNLMALLTGYSEKQAFELCNPKLLDGLSKCNFMWHKYKEHGYKTAYAEDTVEIETFNYLKKGFLKPPTDYYQRPFLIGVANNLPINSRNEKHYCVGRKHYAEYVYDYAEQFVTVHANSSVFGLFWANSFSHSQFDAPSSMDYRIVKYLRTFEARGVFERSIVIFLSDHGMRFGPLRSLRSGYLEERLPFFFISLPQWFQRAHPDFVAALEVNRNRLTSPYDIHMTLHHILELNMQNRTYPQALGCPKCQSIFRTMPEQRTCADAGIDQFWCTCDNYQHITELDHMTVVSITELLILEINRYLVRKKLRNCAILKLSVIRHAEKLLLTNGKESYRVMFEARPNRPLFHATIQYDHKNHNIEYDLLKVSRINQYDTKCVAPLSAKKFCICNTRI